MIKNNSISFSAIIIALILITAFIIPIYLCYSIFLYYYGLEHSNFWIFSLPIVILLIYILYLLFFIIESKVILFFLDTKKKEGCFKVNANEPAVRLWFINSFFAEVIESMLDKLLIPKGFIGPIIYSIYGLKHKNVGGVISPLFDPYLTEIGEYSVMGRKSIISAHFMVNGYIYIKKVKIGNNVTIGANSIIGPGAVIGNNVIVGVNSFVSRNQVLKGNSFYAGNPAKFIKKIDCDYTFKGE